MNNYYDQYGNNVPIDPYTGMPVNPSMQYPMNGMNGPYPNSGVYPGQYMGGYPNGDNVIRRTGRGRGRFRNRGFARPQRRRRRSSGNLSKAVFIVVVVIAVAFGILYLIQNGFGVSITEIPRVDTE